MGRGSTHHGNHPEQFSARQWYFASTHLAAAAYGPAAPFLTVPGTVGDLAYGVHHAVGTFAGTLYIGGENPALGETYFYATIGAFTLQALGRLGRTRPVHSLDGGDSLLGWMLRKATGRRIEELTLRGIIEPALLGGAAILVADRFSPALGVVFGFNAGGLALVAAVAGQGRKAEDRAMRDAMADIARVTGRWPNSPLGRELARSERPGKVIAKRILAACAIFVGWLAWTGQLGYQAEGLRVAAIRLAGRWEHGESVQQAAAVDPHWDEVRRRVQRATDRQEQLRRWRAYNRANGFY
jgi:hypothetical protein